MFSVPTSANPSKIVKLTKLRLQITAGLKIFQETPCPLPSRYVDNVIPSTKIGTTKPVKSFTSTDSASASPERANHRLCLVWCQTTTKSMATAAKAIDGTPIITEVLSRKNSGTMITSGKKKMAASLPEVICKN